MNLGPLVPAKAGTQLLAMDARFRGHERDMAECAR
jgi:hypothetical protein